MSFVFYRQLNAADCGPTCLKMVAKYYGKHYNTQSLGVIAGFSKEGVSLFGISTAAERIGFRTRGVLINFENLEQLNTPTILHWNSNHFVVYIKSKKDKVIVADPARRIIKFSKKEFLDSWISTKNEEGELGIALIIEPTPAFYQFQEETVGKVTWGFLFRYLRTYKSHFSKIILSLAISSVLQLAFPFLTQNVVDIGINTQNLHFVTIILVAQLMLTLSTTLISFIRSRVQLRMSNGLSLSILSDFWIKLTRLPLAYFDTHNTGDIFQRLNDNRQLQAFLTSSSVTTLFSVVNFFLYTFVLIFYSVQLFLVYCMGYLLYFVWIKLFLAFRRKLNIATFELATKENTASLQLIQGMQEIRLNIAEKNKRWEWENIQTRIFKLSFRTLNYEQIQSTGALFINQSKDIFITYLVAQMVINGSLTFGAMLAVQYIIGQLNSPLQQFVGFIQSYQDAKISVERLNEINCIQDEEPVERKFIDYIPSKRGISISNLTFSYPGSLTHSVLKDITFFIPEGKVTAIVGVSGSGKTTLLKILLKIYTNYTGEIKITKAFENTMDESVNFHNISPTTWRQNAGSVLQDGYIFDDTIAKNIALGAESIDYERLIECCINANILGYVESVPNGFNTILGKDGVGLSQGQKQRLLIARALYRNPHYIFLDEATNSLDANNERFIVERLNQVFKGRTVVIIAHRLSTVRNADNIVVIQNGTVAEQGKHEQLIAKKGGYFELVKNQLELGS